jgi:hypothetical protein
VSASNLDPSLTIVAEVMLVFAKVGISMLDFHALIEKDSDPQWAIVLSRAC